MCASCTEHRHGFYPCLKIKFCGKTHQILNTRAIEKSFASIVFLPAPPPLSVPREYRPRASVVSPVDEWLDATLQSFGGFTFQKKILCLFQPAATGIGFKFPLCSSPFPKGPPQAVLSLGFGGAAGSYLACTYRQHPLRRCEWSEYHAAEALSVVTGRPQVEKGMI